MRDMCRTLPWEYTLFFHMKNRCEDHTLQLQLYLKPPGEAYRPDVPFLYTRSYVTLQ